MAGTPSFDPTGVNVLSKNTSLKGALTGSVGMVSGVNGAFAALLKGQASAVSQGLSPNEAVSALGGEADLLRAGGVATTDAAASTVVVSPGVPGAVTVSGGPANFAENEGGADDPTAAPASFANAVSGSAVQKTLQNGALVAASPLRAAVGSERAAFEAPAQIKVGDAAASFSRSGAKAGASSVLHAGMTAETSAVKVAQQAPSEVGTPARIQISAKSIGSQSVSAVLDAADSGVQGGAKSVPVASGAVGAVDPVKGGSTSPTEGGFDAAEQPPRFFNVKQLQAAVTKSGDGPQPNVKTASLASHTPVPLSGASPALKASGASSPAVPVSAAQNGAAAVDNPAIATSKADVSLKSDLASAASPTTNGAAAGVSATQASRAVLTGDSVGTSVSAQVGSAKTAPAASAELQAPTSAVKPGSAGSVDHMAAPTNKVSLPQDSAMPSSSPVAEGRSSVAAKAELQPQTLDASSQNARGAASAPVQIKGTQVQEQATVRPAVETVPSLAQMVPDRIRVSQVAPDRLVDEAVLRAQVPLDGSAEDHSVSTSGLKNEAAPKANADPKANAALPMMPKSVSDILQDQEQALAKAVERQEAAGKASTGASDAGQSKSAQQHQSQATAAHLVAPLAQNSTKPRVAPIDLFGSRNGSRVGLDGASRMTAAAAEGAVQGVGSGDGATTGSLSGGAGSQTGAPSPAGAARTGATVGQPAGGKTSGNGELPLMFNQALAMGDDGLMRGEDGEGLDEFAGLSQSGSTSTSSSASAAASTALARDGARHIAQTVIPTLVSQAQRGNQRFEIRMDPPELGKVDVSLEFSKDGKVRAHLTVDRPETLDLFMRDQRALVKALGDAGLQASDDGSLQFSLRGEQGSGQSHGESAGEHANGGSRGGPSNAAASDGTTVSNISKAYSAASTGALDISI
ncbi:flagellar hook-length control protein FliK [Pseudovibrio exalbescens]|uniref:flagellar hook-length control protein FliK n=1 Tax=Pseudovibrio exalbescens TaxID=197461 RepID=UPI000C9A23BA|nr:flagellar hook-length control protein FliK [Pseudovibrio exalbescens]